MTPIHPNKVTPMMMCEITVEKNMTPALTMTQQKAHTSRRNACSAPFMHQSGIRTRQASAHFPPLFYFLRSILDAIWFELLKNPKGPYLITLTRHLTTFVKVLGITFVTFHIWLIFISPFPSGSPKHTFLSFLSPFFWVGLSLNH